MNPNLLFNQLSTQSGIVAILLYDPGIFDDLVLPPGVDKQIFIDTLVQLHGHTPLLHPDPGYLRYYIPVWGRRTYRIWEKLAATLDLDYNPIENYDRHEEYTDKTGRTLDRSTSTITSSNSDTTTNSTGETSMESKISADNASDYQPDHSETGTDKSDSTQNTEIDASDAGTLKDREETDFTHSSRVHGNIGVTTSQQMIESERELVRYDFYKEIADSFKNEFCLLVY